MVQAPEDNFRNIGEIIRKMLEQAGMSEYPAPVIFNFRIYVNTNPGQGPDIDIPGDDEGPIEPGLEVQRVGDEVILVTELPGVSREDVEVIFSGPKVLIQAGDGERVYQASADVPPAEQDTVSVSLRHGVLEVTYREKVLDPAVGLPGEHP